MSFSTNFTPGKKITPPIHLQEKKNEAQGSELSLSCHFLKEPSSISGVFQKVLILNEVQDSNTEAFENSFTKNIRSRVMKSKPAEFLHCRIHGFVLQYIKQTST